MGTKLILETQIVNGTATIILKGDIDEDATFDELSELDVKTYEFDFENVEKLNSCGIRGWISFIDTIADDRTVIYKNCPQVVIEQMSMVFGFVKKGAVIESFYAPYFCNECDAERKIKVNSSDINEQKAPKVNCETCSKEMEFDDIEAQYFSFLKK